MCKLLQYWTEPVAISHCANRTYLARSLHVEGWETELNQANKNCRFPDLEINSMKKTLFTLCLFCTTGAFGQLAASVLSSETQRIEVPSHEQHAVQLPMGEERNLLIGSTNVSGKGARPLWELAPVHYETPLGDTARMLRNSITNRRKPRSFGRIKLVGNGGDCFTERPPPCR